MLCWLVRGVIWYPRGLLSLSYTRENIRLGSASLTTFSSLYNKLLCCTGHQTFCECWCDIATVSVWSIGQMQSYLLIQSRIQEGSQNTREMSFPGINLTSNGAFEKVTWLPNLSPFWQVKHWPFCTLFSDIPKSNSADHRRYHFTDVCRVHMYVKC